MNHSKSVAFEATKEMVIARMQNTNLPVNKDGGENVADFFETIYNKVSEIAKNCDD